MAATAEASPELKRLAGVAATGRKLEKPVCHYSLSWAKDEKPDRQEMRWAAQESLKALGMERHQALVVSHRDGQPHVHVIANRVDPESGKAAGLNRSKLKLSKWAEEYERGQGKIRCPQRERNNARRGQGKRVQDRVSRPTGRHRREEMSPQREQREAIPAGRDGWGGPERERVAWQRAEERGDWEQLQRRRGKALGELEKRSKREWSALYGRHQQQREYLAKDCRGVLGRFRLWRELGGGVREIGGAIRGDKEVLGRFRAELEDRLRWDRVSLGKEHSEAVRGIERKAGAGSCAPRMSGSYARHDDLTTNLAWRTPDRLHPAHGAGGGGVILCYFSMLVGPSHLRVDQLFEALASSRPSRWARLSALSKGSTRVYVLSCARPRAELTSRTIRSGAGKTSLSVRNRSRARRKRTFGASCSRARSTSQASSSSKSRDRSIEKPRCSRTSVKCCRRVCSRRA